MAASKLHSESGLSVVSVAAFCHVCKSTFQLNPSQKLDFIYFQQEYSPDLQTIRQQPVWMKKSVLNNDIFFDFGLLLYLLLKSFPVSSCRPCSFSCQSSVSPVSGPLIIPPSIKTSYVVLPNRQIGVLCSLKVIFVFLFCLHPCVVFSLLTAIMPMLWKPSSKVWHVLPGSFSAIFGSFPLLDSVAILSSFIFISNYSIFQWPSGPVRNNCIFTRMPFFAASNCHRFILLGYLSAS